MGSETGFLNSLGPMTHLSNGALALHCCRVLGSAPDPSSPCPPAPPTAPRPCGQVQQGGGGFAAELLLTSQTLLFASVGSVPLFVPDNLFLCLLTYI